ncbi:MAG TPA: carbamoyl-phosphate synthase large subunit [Alphaproteobacteria bacterium]|nr:carbamoyl-phosphate synthase large subunit [Alphaproteobacteria bacterium]
MPKRIDISSVLIIGAGPIVIGQACEFDYSGVQACKALREEGYRVILVNSNPATIMTDPNIADATYIEPITPDFVAKIISKEQPDALLPTMGGQTGLNVGFALAEKGVLSDHGVEMIGASHDAIAKAEDRELFKQAMARIGLDMPRGAIVREASDIQATLQHVGLPAIIRPSFTLGGEGGGVAYNHEEFEVIVANGLDVSPTAEVLVEESVIGWKEYEMEVMRDCADNCIIVCSIENVDPMGVHTGDSVTVAPALTLTDKEYQIMRNASIAVLREIGVETGGSNVQFAVNQESGRLVVIEMNPRVSRSSALASKATGFPIARVAAKLAVGYTLDEIDNDITGTTPASFEPTIDYIVTKIPRFTFEKFTGTEPVLTTAMKSVGEAMSIGTTFPESLQKALRSMETGLTGLDPVKIPEYDESGDSNAILTALARPTPDRLLLIAMAFRAGIDLEEIRQTTRYDPWFLEQIREIVAVEATVQANGLPRDSVGWRTLKALGFADARLSTLTGIDVSDVTAERQSHGVHAVYRRVDTCAAEFAAQTSYMYSTYETPFPSSLPVCESEPSNRKKIIILGSGPNRIGQGIEFDYCCVHAAYGLREAGYETIMINCNPETVSTDYDTSDRLYFEPLTDEDVIGIARAEAARGKLVGIVVQFGGQTPLKLARALQAAGLPIIGTSPEAIDLAEDRERFKNVLRDLRLQQPANGTCRTIEQALEIAERIGYPVLVRPSYVLGGRAMQIVYESQALIGYVREALRMSGDAPVLIDRFLVDAIEVDVDALSDGTDVYIAGIMEHIEEAGIHSGDSACSLPPHSLSSEIIAELHSQTDALARALKVVGLMNIQFAVKDHGEGHNIYILEVNPRASRTVPFVSKTSGVPIAKIAARIMVGEKLSSFGLKDLTLHHVAVKESVFPFSRFPGVDVLLGPEMKSTGEVMGLDTDFARAFAKSQLASGSCLPSTGSVFVSVRDNDKPAIIGLCVELIGMEFEIVATRGTAAALAAAGVSVRTINKVREGRPHLVDAITDGEVDLIFNTSEGAQTIADSFSLRHAALINGVPYFTTVAGSRAAVSGIAALRRGTLEVATLQSYT